jgi:4-carboxymuconolactone decarboxylase
MSLKTTVDQEKEEAMNALNARERELVALGAAMGSNCVPCIEYHVPQARKAGLNDTQISEAISLADKVRQVPARKVLTAAQRLLLNTVESAAGNGNRPESVSANPPDGPCCG